MNKEALRKELEDFYAEVITFCEQEGIGQEDRDRKWYAKKVKDFGDECIDELINKIEMSNEQLHPLFKDILDKAAKPLDDGQDGRGLRWVKASKNSILPEKSVIIRNILTGRATDGHYIKSASSGKYYVSLNSWIGKRWEVEETEWLDETPALPVADGEGEKVCHRCHGEGMIEKHIPDYEGAPEKDIMIVCPDCEGSGIQP